MRMGIVMWGVLVLAGCGGEKPAPATPAADTVATQVQRDSARLRDTTAHRGDSVMARDTASGL
jgi:hypothetical protein